MDIVEDNPEINCTFAELFTMEGEKYVISDQCIAILEEINCKLVWEDHTRRSFRRAIEYGQSVKKYLIPLLLNGKDPQVLDAVIKVLVNVTVPIEYLISIEIMSKTEMGRVTIDIINKLLIANKEAFTELKCIKAVIDYMKSILEKDSKLSLEQCDCVNNCLLLIRNILHIPEPISYDNHNNIVTTMQNQIIWNLFTQSIDKLLVYLMSGSQKSYWGISITQLIALMYKDQQVNTLQTLLNVWFESSLCESSDDNESNTTPPKQCSGESSPMMSDPTSDSDNGGIDNNNGCSSSYEPMQQESSFAVCDSNYSKMSSDFQLSTVRVKSTTKHHRSSKEREQQQKQTQMMLNINKGNQSNGLSSKTATNFMEGIRRFPSQTQSEISDCGYGTQVDNQESISTSSNEDDLPKVKPVHHPPSNQKQKPKPALKNRNSAILDKKEWPRKKVARRNRNNFKTKNMKIEFDVNFESIRINMKGLLHHTPTNEDITFILKEFTVDFLIKGYGYLIKDLHSQLLSDTKREIETSHFFWLISYFLKFAAQLELELENISVVLSYDVISYLTFEAVNLCEELELATQSAQESDVNLDSSLKRLQLVIAAIREFLQTLNTYQKITHLTSDEKNYLNILQNKIASTEDLKNLFSLLLIKYNLKYLSKQYLQDLIVSNHVLLLILDQAINIPEYNGLTMVEHLKQFATIEVMHNYGYLLADFQENGEFVNDCIFNMMHHVGGDLGQIATLFQPIILKTFSKIWETEVKLCDDWTDLIEYVINKFINKTQQRPMYSLVDEPKGPCKIQNESKPWTKQQMDCLYWYYVQSKKSNDVVGQIMKQLNDNGQGHKSRIAVIQRLLQQDIISLLEHDKLMISEDPNFESTVTISMSTEESNINIKSSLVLEQNKPTDDIQFLRDRLYKENKGNLIGWLQKILIECCYVKLNIKNNNIINNNKRNISSINYYNNDLKTITQTTSQISNKKFDNMEPVAYHFIIRKQSVPVVPWNAEQTNILVYQPFVLLLHKLGFLLPADTGKLFVRIPEFWTADILYNVALKLGPIQKSILKFDVSQFTLNAFDEHLINKPLNKDFIENLIVSKTNLSNPILSLIPESLLPFSVPNYLVNSNKIIEVNCNQQLLQTCSTEIIENDLSKSNTNLDDHEITSNCDTASVASDLIRMYVSEEEDVDDD